MVDYRLPCVCRQPVGRRHGCQSRQLQRARQKFTLPRPSRNRIAGSAATHEGGRVRRWSARTARENRHGLTQHEYARSGNLSHTSCASSSHWRQMVHLSYVRLRAPDFGCDRKRHPFAVHAGVSGPSAVLRLDTRTTRRRWIFQTASATAI